MLCDRKRIKAHSAKADCACLCYYLYSSLFLGIESDLRAGYETGMLNLFGLQKILALTFLYKR